MIHGAFCRASSNHIKAKAIRYKPTQRATSRKPQLSTFVFMISFPSISLALEAPTSATTPAAFRRIGAEKTPAKFLILLSIPDVSEVLVKCVTQRETAEPLCRDTSDTRREAPPP